MDIDKCEVIFQLHFLPRRRALIKALTQELELLVQKCDPDEQPLCLYAYRDGEWNVTEPPAEVPNDIPEPCNGINKKIKTTSIRGWIKFVATHSDVWLLALTFVKGALILNAHERGILSEKIFSLQTILEETNFYYDQKGIPNHVEKFYNRRVHKFVNESLKQPKTQAKYIGESSDDQPRIKCPRLAKNSGNYCGECEGLYKEGEFWILCDACERWFHGDCVDVSEEESEYIEEYECPACIKIKQIKTRKK